MKTTYIITGPPGAGKSTLADKLSTHLQPGLHLNCDDIYFMVKGGYIPPWEDKQKKRINLALKSALKIAQIYLAADFFVVMDYVFNQEELHRLIDGLNSKIVLCVLLPDVDVNVERDQKRQWVTGEERVRDFHKGFLENKSFADFVLNTTNLLPNEILDKILNLKAVEKESILNKLNI